MQRGYWIRSKPLYDSLVWQTPAVAHLVVAGGEGGIAVLKLFQQMYPKDPIQVLYADLPTAEKNYSDILQQIVLEELDICDSAERVVRHIGKAGVFCSLQNHYP